jgi:hypothetical protein
MLTIVNQVNLSFVQSLACHLFPPVLVDFNMDSPLLFPHTHQFVVKAAQKKDKDMVEFLGVCQECLAYGAPSQPSLKRMEPEQKFSNHSTIL